MRSVLHAALTILLGAAAIAGQGCSDRAADAPAADADAEGRAEAERDIAAGLLFWKVYGDLPATWSGYYQQLFRERLGVQVEHVAGCRVSPDLRARTDGYNERVGQEIESRFGGGALAAVDREAWERYEREWAEERGQKNP